jgi:hypothetical protein
MILNILVIGYDKTHAYCKRAIILYVYLMI